MTNRLIIKLKTMTKTIYKGFLNVRVNPA
jgi:hypothetical protein